MERETLKSRLGFILLSAGCAIGIGNVWKFPYMAGQGGGGAFVLFYLLFLIILGLPILKVRDKCIGWELYAGFKVTSGIWVVSKRRGDDKKDDG